MKNNLPQIKVYEIDYDFIIKNYTDKSLWDKVWTIFVYKNYVFDLSLLRINIKDKEVVFNLKLSSDLDLWLNSMNCEVKYSLNNMTINFLKQLIMSKMIYLIKNLEENYIVYKDELYLKTEKLKESERETLRKIAEEFLDDEGVSNDDIREAYIDKFIDDNEIVWEKLLNIKAEKQYTYLTDLYMILARIDDNQGLIIDIRNNCDSDKIKETEQEVNEYIKYLDTEEFVDDMKFNLETI